MKPDCRVGVKKRAKTIIDLELFKNEPRRFNLMCVIDQNFDCGSLRNLAFGLVVLGPWVCGYIAISSRLVSYMSKLVDLSEIQQSINHFNNAWEYSLDSRCAHS